MTRNEALKELNRLFGLSKQKEELPPYISTEPLPMCKFCFENVCSKVDKSTPSIRVKMPDAGRFIYLFPKRKPTSDLCPYHQGVEDEKNWAELYLRNTHKRSITSMKEVIRNVR